MLLSPIKRISPKQRASKKKNHIRISYPAGLSLSQMPPHIEVSNYIIDRPESRA
jgi:hypothetical protein